MSNVLKFQPVSTGEDYRFDPDEILENAKGQEFATLVILAEYADGTQWVSGSANKGEMLFLIERAKHRLVFED